MDIPAEPMSELPASVDDGQQALTISEEEKLLAQVISLGDSWKSLMDRIVRAQPAVQFHRGVLPSYLIQRSYLYNIEPALAKLTYQQHIFDRPQPFAYAYDWMNSDELNNTKSIIFQAVERYSRYAAQELGLEQPIFDFNDYRKNNIEFCVVLMLFSQGELGGVLFYDNWEIADQEEYTLRFEWWFNGSVHPEHLAKLRTHLPDNLNFSPESTIATGATYYQPFKNNPITKTFADPLIGYTWPTIKASFQSMVKKIAEVHRQDVGPLQEFAQAKIAETEQLSDAAVRELVSSSMGLPLLTFVPCWQTYDTRSLLPTLIADEWRNFEIVINPATQTSTFGQNFICVKASGEIPAFAKSVAIQYANYLRRAEGYDFPTYSQSSPPNQDIYFILQSDYSACVGVVIFKPELSYAAFLQENRMELQQLKNKYSSTNNIFSVCQTKLEKNIEKVRQRDPYGRPMMLALLEGTQLPPDYNKYYNKMLKYSGLSFFTTIQDKAPEDGNIHCLSTVWIHPLCRRKGLLTQLWPVFEQAYGLFAIDGPSKAMKGFLEKQNLNTFEFQSGPLIGGPKI